MLFCLLLVHICCDVLNVACSYYVCTSFCGRVHICSFQSLSVFFYYVFFYSFSFLDELFI